MADILHDKYYFIDHIKIQDLSGLPVHKKILAWLELGPIKKPGKTFQDCLAKFKDFKALICFQ